MNSKYVTQTYKYSCSIRLILLVIKNKFQILKTKGIYLSLVRKSKCDICFFLVQEKILNSK